MRTLPLLLVLACLLPASVAAANTSHEGWPAINGILLMNKSDGSRPLDARPGQDPFGGRDEDYSCDEVHLRGACQRRFVRRGGGRVVSSRAGHNELLAATAATPSTPARGAMSSGATTSPPARARA